MQHPSASQNIQQIVNQNDLEAGLQRSQMCKRKFQKFAFIILQRLFTRQNINWELFDYILWMETSSKCRTNLIDLTDLTKLSLTNQLKWGARFCLAKLQPKLWNKTKDGIYCLFGNQILLLTLSWVFIYLFIY